MKDLFLKHPKNMGESYCGHFRCSSKFSFKMVVGGFACFIHSIFPFLFERTGSNFLFSMMAEYIKRSPVSDERIHHLTRLLKEKTQ